MGIGDWGLGIGPQSPIPIPNPQSPIPNFNYFNILILNISLQNAILKNKIFI